MSVGAPRVRLFVAGPLIEGATPVLTPPQAHYVSRVMRCTVGDRLLAFNGVDGEWQARIDGLAQGRCRLFVEVQRRPQRVEPGPWLLFAAVKRASLDLIVQKATELGAERLWPVFSDRTIAARVGVERLTAIAVEAAEQCGRLTVPAVMAPAPLSAVTAAWPKVRPLYLLDESGGGEPVADAFRRFGSAAEAAPGFLVGPEGGWSADELDALTTLPFVRRIGLGPRILRAETAVLAVLVCWQALAGDWRRPPPPGGDHHL